MRSVTRKRNEPPIHKIFSEESSMIAIFPFICGEKAFIRTILERREKCLFGSGYVGLGGSLFVSNSIHSILGNDFMEDL